MGDGILGMEMAFWTASGIMGLWDPGIGALTASTATEASQKACLQF